MFGGAIGVRWPRLAARSFGSRRSSCLGPRCRRRGSTRRGRDSSFALRASAADSSPAEGKDTAIQHTASTHFRNDAPRNLRIRCETDMIIPFRNGGQHPTLQFSFILNRIYRHMESMAVPLTYFVTVLLLSLLTSAGDMGATCPSLHPTLALPLWSKTARFPLFPPYD